MKKILIGLLLVSILTGIAAADGMIIPVPPPDVRPEKIPPFAIKYHHVNITIDNQYAETEIDQVFKNEFSRDLEGTYIFPIPETASIHEFSMFVEGEKLDGEILKKDEARQIYEDIVRQLIDPALLEYVGQDMFKASVYPIPANGEKRIQLRYSEVIGCESGICHYRYPLEIEKFSSGDIESVLISVRLKSNKPIKAIYSPTHKISVSRINDYEAEVSYEEENVKPEKDFELYYTVSEEDFGLNLLTFKDGENGFFMLLLAPKQETKEEEIIAKDIIFVLDTSGSMAGDKIEQAKSALEFCVNSLNDEDRFNLITFNTNIGEFDDNLVDSNSENKKNALEFISKIEASGGTNINDALLHALDMVEDEERPSIIIFLTDGKPTVGTTDNEKIMGNVKDENSGKARIFVFGVGYDVNTHLLDKISGGNSGASEYVKPEEDIEIKVSDFYSKISNPVLSNLEIGFSGVSVRDSYPKELPDLFKGSQLVLFGRYSGGGDATITLAGRTGKEEKTYSYEANFPEENSENEFIPRLWATRKIGYLMDEIRLHGENEELIDEIINLSMEYGIITPYTSFLVDMDTDLSRPEGIAAAREGFSQSVVDMAFNAVTGLSAIKSAQTTQELKEGDIYESGSTRVEHVGKKTFYQRNGTWVDNDWDGDDASEIKYGSDAYFEFLKNNPETGKYLALGKEVNFCSDGNCYIISEQAGAEAISETTIPTTTIPAREEDTQVLFLSLLVMGILMLVAVAALVYGKGRK
ncbi:MAG: VWA domain-containing protein [Candidatus Altiarchaeales archaeon]|nr:VWA domain-containing protein [Candidatus Altiarchaeota archaeon]MBU4406301.1 VWA domain-containing protein [Candidatus Altiarchaeota archaeon]MCG2782969.1 VWA domain-containing protein [Candidatus Altiarchaeales archaeon]